MENIATIIIGIACIIIGISNRKGNLNLIHSYHRKRVSEEDKLPFGKLVGLGMIIIGISLIISGVILIVGTIKQIQQLYYVGLAITIIGFVVGLGISFYAMKKYNNGIF